MISMLLMQVTIPANWYWNQICFYCSHFVIYFGFRMALVRYTRPGMMTPVALPTSTCWPSLLVWRVLGCGLLTSLTIQAQTPLPLWRAAWCGTSFLELTETGTAVQFWPSSVINWLHSHRLKCYCDCSLGYMSCLLWRLLLWSNSYCCFRFYMPSWILCMYCIHCMAWN